MRNRDIREQRRAKLLLHDPKMFEQLLGGLDETGEGEEDINLGDWPMPFTPQAMQAPIEDMHERKPVDRDAIKTPFDN